MLEPGIFSVFDNNSLYLWYLSPVGNSRFHQQRCEDDQWQLTSEESFFSAILFYHNPTEIPSNQLTIGIHLELTNVATNHIPNGFN